MKPWVQVLHHKNKNKTNEKTPIKHWERNQRILKDMESLLHGLEDSVLKC
jgi:hypothetical protein